MMRFGSIYLGQRYGCFMLWISCGIVEGSGDLLLRTEYQGVWERDTVERCGMERGFCLEQWEFWKESFGAIGLKANVDDTTKDWAEQTKRMMEEIQGTG